MEPYGRFWPKSAGRCQADFDPKQPLLAAAKSSIRKRKLRHYFHDLGGECSFWIKIMIKH